MVIKQITDKNRFLLIEPYDSSNNLIHTQGASEAQMRASYLRFYCTDPLFSSFQAGVLGDLISLARGETEFDKPDTDRSTQNVVIETRDKDTFFRFADESRDFKVRLAEMNVLNLRGKSALKNQAISDRLEISVKTVEAHLDRIAKRLEPVLGHKPSVEEAVRFFDRVGLFENNGSSF